MEILNVIVTLALAGLCGAGGMLVLSLIANVALRFIGFDPLETDDYSD